MKKKFITMISLLLLTGCSNQEYSSSINILNWSSYIPDEVIRDFEKEYKIKVNYGTYSSNEELLAKVSSVREGTYDLIFPSDYMVSIMKNKGLIEKIDKSKLSNYKKIDEKYLGLDYDIDNSYSVPFLGAAVVLVVNREKITGNISSYQDLLYDEYKDDIVLIDDNRSIVGSALMALGYDMNSINEDELKEAQDWLMKLKSNIKAFDSDSPKSFLITKEADIGLMWSAEAMLAKKENPNMEIIIPDEGFVVSIDNFVIMKECKNIDNVYLFIDYILSSDVMEKIVLSYPYSSVNVEVNERMKYQDSFGSDYQKIQDLFDYGTRVENIGKYISLYDKIWAYIK